MKREIIRLTLALSIVVMVMLASSCASTANQQASYRIEYKVQNTQASKNAVNYTYGIWNGYEYVTGVHRYNIPRSDLDSMRRADKLLAEEYVNRLRADSTN